MQLEWLESASITSPLGWKAGAAYAQIKTYGDEPRFDVGLLVSERPCAVGGLFTKNKVCGAPVTVTRPRVQKGIAQALVVNSGCSNVAMGERGIADARKMTESAALHLGLDPELVLVASTGVIARPLPLDRIASVMPRIELARESGRRFTRAMMTTDTVEKVRAVRFEIDGVVYTVAGSAKGSGMVHPDMATVFCFLTTDANVSSVWLQDAVRRVGNASINMVDVDMDTSTSDTMLVFANGAAGGPCLSDNPTQAAQLEKALLAVSVELAKDLARDGEGATTLIEAVVSGAHSEQDARAAARTVVSSPLIKSMITGRDPNLGRVLMALGRSGAELAVERLSVWIGEHQAFARGVPTDLPHAVISQAMASETVVLRADLGLGEHTATAWGCNLTDEYVHINGDYTT
ncbi:MAG TPA: bifunctional glutamate N-acetyltransferase/amino-acid acetyltransferase ArgJ [Polyangiaceae bacterium]|nr:bifunctional glutamate N-acetyltransferase/amino-acid acetyltransferase ArgJ [Polyangiaceae bacterium]